VGQKRPSPAGGSKVARDQRKKTGGSGPGSVAGFRKTQIPFGYGQGKVEPGLGPGLQGKQQKAKRGTSW